MLTMEITKQELKLFYDNIAGGTVSFGFVVVALCFSLALTIAFYVLRSLGLYTLAKNNGIDHAFIAWIPFAWIYTACKLIGDAKIFGWSFKKIAFIALVVFSVNGVLEWVYKFFSYFPLAGYLLQGGTIYAEETSSGFQLIPGSDFVNPYGGAAQAVETMCSVFYYINAVLSLIVLVVTIFMYIALFRKFWPKHYMLAAVLSVMGLFPVFVFAVRKNQAVNYAEYLRARYYGMGYGHNPHQGAQPPTEHPFSEFAERGDVDPGDPFSEFTDEKNKK